VILLNNQKNECYDCSNEFKRVIKEVINKLTTKLYQ